MKKRILALLLAAVMVMALVPSVFAAGSVDIVTYDGYTYTLSNAPTAVKHMVLPAGFGLTDDPEKTVTVYVVPRGTVITPRTSGIGADPVDMIPLCISWKENGAWRSVVSARSYSVDQEVTLGYLYDFGNYFELYDDVYEGDDATLIGNIGDGGFIITLSSTSYDAPGEIYLTTDEDILPEAAEPPVEILFPDVPRATWYTYAANYVAEEGLMVGGGDGKFNPTGITTRAEIWTLLAHIAGVDVKHTGSGQWYQEALDWVKSVNISDGSNPLNYITREELAAMLFNLAKLSGEPSGDSYFLDMAPDGGSVHSWAVDALKWATYNFIILGNSEGMLNPQDTATRAEIAVMIHRYCRTLPQEQ